MQGMQGGKEQDQAYPVLWSRGQQGQKAGIAGTSLPRARFRTQHIPLPCCHRKEGLGFQEGKEIIGKGHNH